MYRSKPTLCLLFLIAALSQLSAQVTTDCYLLPSGALMVYRNSPFTVNLSPETIEFETVFDIVDIYGVPIPTSAIRITTRHPDGTVSVEFERDSDDIGLAISDYKNSHCDNFYQLHSRKPRAAATAAPGIFSPHSAQDFTSRDFNGDGVFDSAVLNRNRLSITLRDSSNNSIGGASYTLPGEGAAVLAADVNGDGKLDLIVSLLKPPGGVAVLLGNGNGTFQQPKSYGASGLDTLSVAAADFNGDGKVDLAVANNNCFGANNSVSVLLGNGDGSFRTPVNFTVGSCPRALVALDLNRDGKFDLAVTDGISQNVFVLLGRGDGSFNTAVTSPANTSAPFIAYADLNRDGIADLALPSATNSIGILLGKGDGTFQAPVHYVAGADPESLALIPNADGSFLAMTADRAAPATVLTPGTAQGTLTSPIVHFVHAASQPAIADATGDGKPDILLLDSQADSPGLLVLPGDGAGGLGAPVSFPFNAPSGYSAAGDIAIGDLNHDGIPDAVLTVGFSGPVSANGGIGVMLGKRGGGFQPMNATPLNANSLAVALGDFNNDGKLDAAVLGSSGISLLPGNGDGTFKPPVQTAVAPGKTPGGVVVTALAAGDFNRDGKLDLFVVGTSGPVVLPGNGAGAFGAPIPVPLSGMGVTSAAVADLNGDGIPDIAVADVNSAHAAILLGKGDGTFRILPPIATDTNPFGLALADLNGDGYPDMALAHCCGLLEVVVYFNNGDGTFGPGFHLPSGPGSRFIAAGDLTGAGKAAIVSAATILGNPNLRGAVTVVTAGNFTLVPAAAALSIQKTWQAASAGNLRRGDPFTYSIKVTNSGNAPATAVNVQDVPDDGADLALQGPLTFNVGTLAPGASQTIAIKASANAAGVYTNNAVVTWSDSAGESASASSTTTTAVDRQPGDFAAGPTAPVPLKTGVQQVFADGAAVYVVNNPGDSLTILDCTRGACNVTSTVSLGAGAGPVAVTKAGSDILVLNQQAGTVTTLLSGSPAQIVVSSVGADPLVFAPFNIGDGGERIAVACAGAVTIFAWDGTQCQPAATVPAGTSPAAVVNGDFNGDGADDLLVADTASGAIQLFLGDGTGGLSPSAELPLTAAPLALATGDVNNDGALDAAVLTRDGLVLLLNDGTGNLGLQPAFTASGAGAVVLADFNGDGNLDAAIANTSGSSVSLYRGDGSGAFTAAGSWLTGKAPTSLTAANLDHNAAADLISANSASRDLSVLLFLPAQP